MSFFVSLLRFSERHSSVPATMEDITDIIDLQSLTTVQVGIVMGFLFVLYRCVTLNNYPLLESDPKVAPHPLRPFPLIRSLSSRINGA